MAKLLLLNGPNLNLLETWRGIHRSTTFATIEQRCELVRELRPQKLACIVSIYLLPPTPSHNDEGEFNHSLFHKAPSPLVGEGWGGGYERLSCIQRRAEHTLLDPIPAARQFLATPSW